MNLKAGELINFFEDGGFVVDQIKPVENMPSSTNSKFSDLKLIKFSMKSLGRKEGYKLNFWAKYFKGYF